MRTSRGINRKDPFQQQQRAQQAQHHQQKCKDNHHAALPSLQLHGSSCGDRAVAIRAVKRFLDRHPGQQVRISTGTHSADDATPLGSGPVLRTCVEGVLKARKLHFERVTSQSFRITVVPSNTASSSSTRMPLNHSANNLKLGGGGAARSPQPDRLLAALTRMRNDQSPCRDQKKDEVPLASSQNATGTLSISLCDDQEEETKEEEKDEPEYPEHKSIPQETQKQQQAVEDLLPSSLLRSITDSSMAIEDDESDAEQQQRPAGPAHHDECHDDDELTNIAEPTTFRDQDEPAPEQPTGQPQESSSPPSELLQSFESGEQDTHVLSQCPEPAAEQQQQMIDNNNNVTPPSRAGSPPMEYSQFVSLTATNTSLQRQTTTRPGVGWVPRVRQPLAFQEPAQYGHDDSLEQDALSTLLLQSPSPRQLVAMAQQEAPRDVAAATVGHDEQLERAQEASRQEYQQQQQAAEQSQLEMELALGISLSEQQKRDEEQKEEQELAQLLLVALSQSEAEARELKLEEEMIEKAMLQSMLEFQKDQKLSDRQLECTYISSRSLRSS